MARMSRKPGPLCGTLTLIRMHMWAKPGVTPGAASGGLQPTLISVHMQAHPGVTPRAASGGLQLCFAPWGKPWAALLKLGCNAAALQSCDSTLFRSNSINQVAR
eukprot:99029-Chlamydomonas_euryale.AAC.4